jgi:S-adenosylmethionine-diacylgycerolhomoserine-N-methlytransferase
MENLRHYYKTQSAIYDATRWAFLFGRTQLLRELAKIEPNPRHVVEIGCGTGRNLAILAGLFPQARITGVDLSENMLAIAAAKTAPFGDRVMLQLRVQGGAFEVPHDVVVFSYSLSMMNPGWDVVLRGAVDGLEPWGLVAAVDFHDSALRLFKWHMSRHHVRMDRHLLPALGAACRVEVSEVRTAYSGLWKYFLFVGRKDPALPRPAPSANDSRK